MPRSLTLSLLAFITTAAALTGCDSLPRSAQEDALWRQNQELQAEVLRSRNQSQGALGERERLIQENTELRELIERERAEKAAVVQPVALPAAPPQPRAASNTALASIEGVEVVETRGEITVRVPGDVLFAPGQATLKETSKKTLDRLAAEIKRSYPSSTIRVEGHTDTDKITKSKWHDNLALSLERAASVHRYLESRGVSDRHMYAAGFGDTRPRRTKESSRRVEIVVVK
jgi:flagellar motor protein MotB